MSIKSLEIQNFKGISQLIVQPDGHNVTVTGQNGAGKSSIVYAWQWVLGLDAGEVRPIIDGYPVLPTTYPNVSVSFDNDVTICRVFHGSSSKYYIDDVIIPSKAAYLAKIAELLNTKHVSIFSQLGQFPSMDWKQRREILMSMCSVKNEDVLAKNDEFVEIFDKVDRTGVEEVRKALKSQQKICKDKLQAIPYEIKGLNYSQKDDLGNKEKLNEELAAKNEELRAVEAKIKALQEEATPQIDNNDKIQQLQHDKTIIWGQVQCLQTRRDMLRKEYKEVANATPGICTHCGQAIPLETFKAKQAKKLAKMQKEGDEINAQLATYNEQLQDYEAHIQKLQDSQVHCGPDNSSQLLAQNLQEKLLLEREIDRIGQQLELIKEQDHRSARIAQLQNQQIQLENTMNELNIQLQLLKDFQQTKCRLIEQNMSSLNSLIIMLQLEKSKIAARYYWTTSLIVPRCRLARE